MIQKLKLKYLLIGDIPDDDEQDMVSIDKLYILKIGSPHCLSVVS